MPLKVLRLLQASFRELYLTLLHTERRPSPIDHEEELLD